MIKNNDWSNLKVSKYGNPNDIPKLLNYIFYNDKTTYAKDAHGDLENLIVCQAYLYESAFFVIPYLIDELKSNNHNGRYYAYELLIEIANGFTNDNILVEYKEMKMNLDKACRLSIIDESELYLSEINRECSSNKSIKSSLYLLGTFKEEKNILFPILNELLVKNPGFKSDIQSAIEYLLEPE